MATQNLQDQYIKVGPIKTRFWAHGDEGPYLLLLHGIGASVESWMLNIHALAQSHQVYAMDLVGSGLSEKPIAPYTLSYLADFVNQFMRVQGIDQASLVGHSLGGGIALKLAINRPEQVEKIVLVNSAGLGKEGHILFRLSSLPILGEFLTRPSRKSTAKFLKECVYDPDMLTDELVELNYRLTSQPGAQRAYLSTLRAIANLFGAKGEVIDSIVNNLDKIEAKTLIVWGAQDRILPVSHGYIAKEKIANAQIHVFDQCGHLTPMEKSEAFNEMVSIFLIN